MYSHSSTGHVAIEGREEGRDMDCTYDTVHVHVLLLYKVYVMDSSVLLEVISH